MRHRLTAGFWTGFGNSKACLLPNKGKLDKNFSDAAYDAYFKDLGFDFKIHKDYVAVGIEPGYQFEPLLIITIHRNKKKSTLVRGRALGAYGSGLQTTIKTYEDYVKRGKFVKFVDQWHSKLFKRKNRK